MPEDDDVFARGGGVELAMDALVDLACAYLDRTGQLTGTLVIFDQRATVAVVGAAFGEEPMSAREAWARAGVAMSNVASTASALGMPGTVDRRGGRQVSEAVWNSRSVARHGEENSVTDSEIRGSFTKRKDDENSPNGDPSRYQIVARLIIVLAWLIAIGYFVISFWAVSATLYGFGTPTPGEVFDAWMPFVVLWFAATGLLIWISRSAWRQRGSAGCLIALIPIAVEILIPLVYLPTLSS